MDARSILKTRFLNGWPLFWLVSVILSVVMLLATINADIGTPAGISSMISFSVRLSVPFIYLVIAASSLQILFPGSVPSWLLRNRKFIGLCFAVAMAWQGLFIFIISTMYRDYYFDEIFFLRDEIEGSTGYIFLAALVITSFRFGRRWLTQEQWKLLHKSGVYFLWAYAFSVYWWNLYYYEGPTLIDYVYYWAGFLAFGSRIAAWGKQRQRAISRDSSGLRISLVNRVAGLLLIALGLVVAATGLLWQETATRFLTAPAWSANLELWLPFWPFEPFLSLFIVGLGTLLTTRSVVVQDATEQTQGA